MDSVTRALARWVKRCCFALAAQALLLMPMAEAQTELFTFTNINGTISITGASCGSVACLAGAVTIPNAINGLPVIGIADDAFYRIRSP